ncbi:hypothetical protein [Mesorhizobium sp. 113-3-3]|uniref:hypothetical protein n=1 Tax=Mesorhizobium sp. 113-3-3 TaxID=2744516 RepID=UPI0019271226|nr:hypothetical protein [Mesorhizobium sp. 113-3-3]BCG83781.1 hypothetical protein MesoLj113b_73230 [Mesorhizobium sp. 113-3-3]
MYLSSKASQARGPRPESAIVDGEIIVLNEAGISEFGESRNAITQHDLYSSHSTCCTLLALEERRAILANMIPPGGRVQFSDLLQGEAKAIS